jgi:4-hydroxy-tetrahydrodipicolinate reductase
MTSLHPYDCSVNFELQHNVCGRRVYAEGTADAVEFLVKQRAAGGSKRLFNMIDVLESGQMK